MTAAELEQSWQTDPRWAGVRRLYKGDDVVRLRGSIQIEHTLARLGAERLWNLLHTEPYVPALGTLTGNQAVEQSRPG
jgi:isocitrate lyase